MNPVLRIGMLALIVAQPLMITPVRAETAMQVYEYDPQEGLYEETDLQPRKKMKHKRYTVVRNEISPLKTSFFSGMARGMGTVLGFMFGWILIGGFCCLWR